MSRRAGVLPNTYVASLRPKAVAARQLPPAYSWIEGTPIYLGENDRYGDCVTTAAFNACAIADMRKGIKRAVDNTAPFALYEDLGGMPADIGLDPAVLIRSWMSEPISGYLLKNIWSIALTDFDGMKEAIEDTGFVYLTATLDVAQLSQQDWAVVTGSPEDGGHAFLSTGWIGSRFTDDTWGAECWFEKNFIAAQGQNAWRLELEAA
jgi:hypothetical protein